MFSSFYLNRIVYYTGFVAAALFAASYFWTPLFSLASIVLICLSIAVAVDTLLLYSKKTALTAFRTLPERMSNGDDNKVAVSIKNEFGFILQGILIDELPFQFQLRNWKRTFHLQAEQTTTINYFLKPTERGHYQFGRLLFFVKSPLRLVVRRISIAQEQLVKVYPSYVQMRRYQLLAAANRLQEAGVKKTRRLGHSLEFEQIKEYVRGDDYRTINWKATARRGDLMVNNHTDERSQQIYCIINKGRIMKMPFDGMTLLDYSINAALVLLNVALMRQDRAGLISFAHGIDSFLPADKRPGQLNKILEALYKQTTQFFENDYEKLFSVIRNRITQRSLLVLFTNFESLESLQRELPALKKMAHYHLLLVVFFENTELKQLSDQKARNTETIYIKTIAEKYQHEKRLMVRELQKAGIVALLTAPQHLTINAINKYLELKNKQSI